jgi:hypothetical protein
MYYQISDLENPKNKMFLRVLYEGAKAEGGCLVKEQDFGSFKDLKI